MIALTESVDILEVCVESFNENTPYSEELNREQLDEGKKSDGGYLKDYSFATKRIKDKKGQQLDPPNLLDEGDFRAEIKHLAVGEDISYISTDYKFPLLVKRDGPAILGLNAESKMKLIPRLQETQQQILNKHYNIS